MVKLKRMISPDNKQQGKTLNKKVNKMQFGFTLVEVMITVGIVGILASIAYPSYTEYVTSSNRTEGQGELLRFANLQEQYFVDYRTYTKDLKKLGESYTKIDTAHGHYEVEVASADGVTFVINATPKGAQATNDSGCAPLTINQAGQKGPEGCWD